MFDSTPLRYNTFVKQMVGRTLHHYRIESKVAEGGMGVVYLALDTHLDRRVAIKVLSPNAL